MVPGEAAWQGRHSCASAMAAGGLQGLQALSPRRWPPLGAFIKLPALRVVHDYGAVQNIWVDIVRGVCGAGGGGGAGTQAIEMTYGARFLWDLDHKWLGKAPVNPGNLLVIAGTASGLSDGIVRTASAALPEDFFLPVGHILYVPYRYSTVVFWVARGNRHLAITIDCLANNEVKRSSARCPS